MSSKKIHSDASEKKTQNTNDSDVINESNNAKIAIEKDNQNVECNDSKETESVDVKIINYNEIENENNEDKVHTDNAKTSHKKDLFDSNVAAHLKSDLFHHTNQEDIELEEISVALPEYTEIDVIGNNSKYVNKDTKGSKSSRKKDVIPYVKQLLTVQFMGSEALPEDEVLMEYNPKDNNRSIKYMFLIKSLMSLATSALINVLIHFELTRDALSDCGIFVAGATFTLELTLVVIAACKKGLRKRFPLIALSAVAVLIRSIGEAGFNSFYGLRYGIYVYFMMWMSDIACLFLGCCPFDYQSGFLFFVIIATYVVSLIILTYIARFYKISLHPHNYTTYYNICGHPLCIFMNVAYGLMLQFFTIMQLRFLLKGEWIELAEKDYLFGAYLLHVALFDYPLRVLRELGAFEACDPGDEEQEEK